MKFPAKPSPHPNPLPSHPMGAEREQQRNIASHSARGHQSPIPGFKAGAVFVSICCGCLLALSTFGNSLPGDQHWDNQFGYPGASDQLRAVSVLGGKVYIGGGFTAAGNSAANNIAGYDGTNWFPLNNGASGLENNVYALA